MLAIYSIYKVSKLYTITDFNIYDESLKFDELFSNKNIIKIPPDGAKLDDILEDKG